MPEPARRLPVPDARPPQTAPPADIHPAPQPRRDDPQALRAELARALQSRGIHGISVAVDARMRVTLGGAVTQPETKARALALAHSFHQASGVRDLVFVVDE